MVFNVFALLLFESRFYILASQLAVLFNVLMLTHEIRGFKMPPVITYKLTCSSAKWPKQTVCNIRVM